MNKQEFIAYLQGVQSMVIETDMADMLDDIIAKAQELDLNFNYTPPPTYPIWPPTTWLDTTIDVAKDVSDWSVNHSDDGSWSIKKGCRRGVECA